MFSPTQSAASDAAASQRGSEGRRWVLALAEGVGFAAACLGVGPMSWTGIVGGGAVLVLSGIAAAMLWAGRGRSEGRPAEAMRLDAIKRAQSAAGAALAAGAMLSGFTAGAWAVGPPVLLAAALAVFAATDRRQRLREAEAAGAPSARVGRNAVAETPGAAENVDAPSVPMPPGDWMRRGLAVAGLAGAGAIAMVHPTHASLRPLVAAVAGLLLVGAVVFLRLAVRRHVDAQRLDAGGGDVE